MKKAAIINPNWDLAVRFLLFIFLPNSLFAQSDLFLKKYQFKEPHQPLLVAYWNTYKAIDAAYYCEKNKNIDVKTVSNRTFDSLLRPALSNVFVGSNDLTKNTTAASFTQDDKTGTLNLNYAYLRNKQVCNIGAFSKSSDGVFGVYTGNSWSSDVGFTLGYSFPLASGLYFDKDDCEEVKRNRRTKAATLLNQFKELMTYDVDSLRRDFLRLQNALNSIADVTLPPADYAEKNNQLHLVDSVITLYESVVTTIEQETDPQKKDTLLHMRVDSLISEWEVKNAAIFTGYNIVWLSVSAAISNNTISLNTDSLPAVLKKEYIPKNLAKVLIGITGNWQNNTKRYLTYLSGGINFGLHHFLDHPSVKKPGLRFDTLGKVSHVYNQNETLLAKYDDLKADIYTLEPTINCSFFFAAAKQFGWNIRTDFRIPINLPSETKEIYPTTFNAVMGPLFRLNKDKSVSAGTVGLDIGIVDCPVDSDVWKSFAFKFKVGVPFNALIK